MKTFNLLILSLVIMGALAHAQGPPPLCKPCLFYGGDLNPNDPQADGFPDMYTLTFPNTRTYAPMRVPVGHSVLIEGILFQIQIEGFPKLDPQGAGWEIRSGLLQSNNGGTLIASGQIGAAVEPAGRTLNYPEFTVGVKVNPPVQLDGGTKGTTYWFNLMPACVNPNDPACSEPSQQYFVSNTTQQSNSFRGNLQPTGAGYINSNNSSYHYYWETLCSAGFRGCDYVSFGLMGKILQ